MYVTSSRDLADGRYFFGLVGICRCCSRRLYHDLRYIYFCLFLSCLQGSCISQFFSSQRRSMYRVAPAHGNGRGGGLSFNPPSSPSHSDPFCHNSGVLVFLEGTVRSFKVDDWKIPPSWRWSGPQGFSVGHLWPMAQGCKPTHPGRAVLITGRSFPILPRSE
jgi:hypothetical protein